MLCLRVLWERVHINLARKAEATTTTKRRERPTSLVSTTKICQATAQESVDPSLFCPWNVVMGSIYIMNQERVQEQFCRVTSSESGHVLQKRNHAHTVGHFASCALTWFCSKVKRDNSTIKKKNIFPLSAFLQICKLHYYSVTQIQLTVY